jgi:hypothetical protein
MVPPTKNGPPAAKPSLFAMIELVSAIWTLPSVSRESSNG